MTTFGLPPLFSNVPVELVAAQTIAEFPANTFLESIAVSADNTLFITNHYEGKIIRIDAGGVPADHAIVAGKATGLAFIPNGNLLLSGWNEEDTSVIWQVSPQGIVEVLTNLPDAMFLNGLTRLTDSLYLIADSYRGAIWQLDILEKSVQIWLEHPQLARNSPDNPFPGVNGLKIFNGVLHASNTEKTQLVKIPIQENHQPGEPEVFLTGVNLDDFAFDRQGNLYATTHVFNSVVKITPDGGITTIAQIDQGMAGTTALTFGQSPADQTCVYVTTNGGMSFPPATGVESAKVVRLDVGIPGLPLL
jgi:hypothetical protein